ncbi:MAG TPA: RDD family protein [Thermoanaerobaculia bacterium]
MPGVETVGFGRRAVARIIDMIIHFGVGLFSGIFAALMVGIYAAVSGTSPEAAMATMKESGAAAFLLSLLGSILYESICEGLHGSTAGKYLMGMVVLREDGSPCTYVQAIGRAFAFFIDGLFFGLVAYSSMKDSPRDQRYGDKWSGTIVVTRASAPEGTLRMPLRFFGVLLLALFLDGAALLAGMFV